MRYFQKMFYHKTRTLEKGMNRNQHIILTKYPMDTRQMVLLASHGNSIIQKHS